MLSGAEFEKIVLDNAPAMYRAARSMLCSNAEAEDAVGSAVLAAWRRLDTLRDAGRARAWLVKITVNCARQQLRDRRPYVPYEELPQELPAPEAEPSLWGAVSRLCPERRAVVTLYYYEGFSTLEIARLLGIRPGTVKSRLARAREDLKRMLEEE